MILGKEGLFCHVPLEMLLITENCTIGDQYEDMRISITANTGVR